MKLISYWRSQASFRVRIALRLKGLVAETTSLDLLKGDQFDQPTGCSIRRWLYQLCSMATRPFVRLLKRDMIIQLYRTYRFSAAAHIRACVLVVAAHSRIS